MTSKRTYKLMALILAVAMCVTILPAPAFAQQYTVDRNTPYVQDDNEEYLMQVVDEIVAEILAENELPMTEDYYSADVLEAINQGSADLMDYIREHPDEIELWGMFLMVSDEVGERLNALEMLVFLTRDTYSGPKDVKSLKKSMEKAYKKITKGKKRALFNDWYWDKYMVVKTDAKKKINAIKDLPSYIEASKAQLYVSFQDEDEIWYEEGQEIIDFDEYLFDNDIDENTIVTKKTLAQAVRAGDKGLKSARKVCEKGTGFKPSGAVVKQIKNFRKEASGLEDMNMIADLYTKIDNEYRGQYVAYLDQLWEEKPDQMLTSSDCMRWANKVEKKYFSLDHSKYTDKQMKKLREKCYSCYWEMFEIDTQKQANAIWKKYLKFIKNV